ncbi:MAG: hypothetical protein AB7X49_15115 [Geminicoccaceae bacterium]
MTDPERGRGADTDVVDGAASADRSTLVPAAGAGRLSAALALVGAVGLFAAMAALVKLVSARYALGEIIFYRGFFATLVLLALAPGQGAGRCCARAARSATRCARWRA